MFRRWCKIYCLRNIPYIMLFWKQTELDIAFKTKNSPCVIIAFVVVETSELRRGKNKKLHGLSPRANYTDRATAACRRSDFQLVRIEGTTWSAWRIPPAVFSRFSRQEPLLFYQVAPQLYWRGWVDPVPDPLLLSFPPPPPENPVVAGIVLGPPDL
jgi:hypothetical protein